MELLALLSLKIIAGICVAATDWTNALNAVAQGNTTAKMLTPNQVNLMRSVKGLPPL